MTPLRRATIHAVVLLAAFTLGGCETTTHLRVTKLGSGNATVTFSAPAAPNNTCVPSPSCVKDYGESPSPVSVSAAGIDIGDVFGGWGGECGPDTCTSVSPASPSAMVFVGFSRQTTPPTTGMVNLTVVKTGQGVAAVTTSPTGTACGPDCEAFPFGKLVTLTPAPDQTSIFGGWTGCDTTHKNTCLVVVTATRSVRVLINRRRRLTVEVETGVSGVGEVSIDGSTLLCPPNCTRTVVDGDTVSLRATAGSKSVWGGWVSGPCTADSGNRDCSITINSDVTVTARFIGDFPLTVNRSGMVSVVVNKVLAPAVINPPIDCGPGCSSQSAEFAADTALVIDAFPAPGYIVTWGNDACRNTTGPKCFVTMGMSAASVTVGARLPP